MGEKELYGLTSLYVGDERLNTEIIDTEFSTDADELSEWKNFDTEGGRWQASCDLSFFPEDKLKKAFRQPKLPRKMKKALKQMWKISDKGCSTEYTFTPLRRTKAQRKVFGKIRISDGMMYVPMPNGHIMVFGYGWSYAQGEIDRYEKEFERNYGKDKDKT